MREWTCSGAQLLPQATTGCLRHGRVYASELSPRKCLVQLVWSYFAQKELQWRISLQPSSAWASSAPLACAWVQGTISFLPGWRYNIEAPHLFSAIRPAQLHPHISTCFRCTTFGSALGELTMRTICTLRAIGRLRITRHRRRAKLCKLRQ